ncbi:MAG: GIY-YIG nuclease family protein [Bacteroidota bacterium]
MYVVYILHSEEFDKIHVGYTSNLEERIRSHNELAAKGWTIGFRPWLAVYTEEHPTKKEALIREKQLKSSRGRHFIRHKTLSNKP